MAQKKGFFAGHAKSSAAVISLGIHALFFIIAITFVAVTVITREEQKFEAKPVNRPKMQLKKLQVPVEVKKKKQQKPKLRKRIVVKPKMNQNMPDIKMPEISGVKGGLGSAGAGGLGGGGGVGFSMPEIEIFGIKGKGEKIVLVLDGGADMMRDKIGGIEAYTIIKEELIRIVEELPPTALFNVIVFDWDRDALAFPNLVPASDTNVQKLKGWLTPLNAVKRGMGDSDWGIKTIGPGGVENREKLVAGKFKFPSKVGATDDNAEIDVRAWYRPAMQAHKMGADTIFILSDGWDLQRVPTGKAKSREEWDKTAAGQKWAESHRKGLKMLDEDNKQRAAAGKPPKVLPRNEWAINGEYFPDIEKPPSPEWYYYEAKDFAEAFLLIRSEYAKDSMPSKSGISDKKKTKMDFSFNVIQFVEQGSSANQDDSKFTKLTALCKGDYKTIAGLEEIKSYVTPDETTAP